MALLKTDPIDLATTITGDLSIRTGLSFTTGTAAVAQGLRIRLLMFLGEWFLDLSMGIPYLNIIGQAYDDVLVRTVFRKVILSCPGVQSLASLAVSLNSQTRQLTVSWTVVTVFGDTVTDTLTRTI